MKEDDKWIQRMRKQLEDYSEPLPAGLWEAIEKDLNQTVVQPKVIPLWKRWQAIAAAVAILVVSSTAVWLWQRADQLPVGQIPMVADVSFSVPEVDKSLSVEAEVMAGAAHNQISQVNSSSLAVVAALPSCTESLVSVESDSKDNVPVVEESPVSSVDESRGQAKTGVNPAEQRIMQRKSDREQMRRNSLLAVADEPSASRGWQIGVATGNSFSSVSNNFQGLSTLGVRSGLVMGDNLAMNSMSDNGMAYTQVLFNNRDRASETSVHHRMPITVGATLSYVFSDRWSIETGVTYTLLSSELHSGAQSYIEEEQKLHYVGIPLRVKHTFWQNKRLAVYAVAGGAVEKCVSGSLETLYVTGSSDRKSEHTSLDVKALQWSVSAAAGIQFNLVKQLGVYVEPGLAYYFDDGSGMETSRKEYPCNFNLQLGLRFTLSK